MNLKKSDKIIAVVAAFILIIAAIGIIIWPDSGDDVNNLSGDEEKILSFPINEDYKPGQSESKSATFKKGLFYLRDETVPEMKFTVPVGPIKSIKFEVRYTDAQTSLTLIGILLKILGKVPV